MFCHGPVAPQASRPLHCPLFVTLGVPFVAPDPPAPAKAGDPGSIPDSRHRRSRCRDPLRRVMRCHVLSCAPGAAALSGRPAGLLLSASFMRFLLRVSFHSRRRPPGRGADPVSRVSRARLRPGAGGRFAAARFARLIARARVRRRTHLSRRFLRGLFSRRRETEKEAAPRGCHLPFLIHCSILT